MFTAFSSKISHFALAEQQYDFSCIAMRHRGRLLNVEQTRRSSQHRLLMQIGRGAAWRWCIAVTWLWCEDAGREAGGGSAAPYLCISTVGQVRDANYRCVRVSSPPSTRRHAHDAHTHRLERRLAPYAEYRYMYIAQVRLRARGPRNHRRRHPRHRDHLRGNASSRRHDRMTGLARNSGGSGVFFFWGGAWGGDTFIWGAHN